MSPCGGERRASERGVSRRPSLQGPGILQHSRHDGSGGAAGSGQDLRHRAHPQRHLAEHHLRRDGPSGGQPGQGHSEMPEEARGGRGRPQQHRLVHGLPGRPPQRRGGGSHRQAAVHRRDAHDTPLLRVQPLLLRRGLRGGDNPGRRRGRQEVRDVRHERHRVYGVEAAGGPGDIGGPQSGASP